MSKPPILDHKFYDQPSEFQPENLLREARRQKEITELVIPEVCILDPDGDIEEYVIQKHNVNWIKPGLAIILSFSNLSMKAKRLEL